MVTAEAQPLATKESRAKANAAREIIKEDASRTRLDGRSDKIRDVKSGLQTCRKVGQRRSGEMTYLNFHHRTRTQSLTCATVRQPDGGQ